MNDNPREMIDIISTHAISAASAHILVDEQKKHNPLLRDHASCVEMLCSLGNSPWYRALPQPHSPSSHS